MHQGQLPHEPPQKTFAHPHHIAVIEENTELPQEVQAAPVHHIPAVPTVIAYACGVTVRELFEI